MPAVKDERDHLRDHLQRGLNNIDDLTERAAAAEAKLEQIENQIAIIVVHSQQVQDGREDDRRPNNRPSQPDSPSDGSVVAS